MDTHDAFTKALTFLKERRSGVIATSGHDGVPHASAIHYYVDDAMNMYFITQMRSRKYAALSAHPQVALAVGSEDVPQTVQIEGKATDITLDESAPAIRIKVMEVISANPHYAAPITKMDPSAYAIIWIQPTWVRFADFAATGAGDTSVYSEVTL